MIFNWMGLNKQGLNSTGYFNLGFILGLVIVMLISWFLGKNMLDSMFMGCIAGFALGLFETLNYREPPKVG